MKHQGSPACTLALILGLLLSTSCSAGGQEIADVLISSTPGSTAAIVNPTSTSTHTPVPVESPTLTHSASTVQPEPGLCTPLEGVNVADIPTMVTNPFAPPPPGRDEAHQGIDIAQRDPQTQISLEGLRVQAVFAGRVAASINDRFPYGNALIIETLKSELPEGLEAKLPTPAPTPMSRSPLNCPDVSQIHTDAAEQDSLYLLYAHLKEPSSLQPGASVSCGQTLGVIGSTGNALNPHLHLEARLGPAGTRFASLSHYDSRATTEEMANYCYWRISGWFRLIDPLITLGLTP